MDFHVRLTLLTIFILSCGRSPQTSRLTHRAAPSLYETEPGAISLGGFELEMEHTVPSGSYFHFSGPLASYLTRFLSPSIYHPLSHLVDPGAIAKLTFDGRSSHLLSLELGRPSHRNLFGHRVSIEGSVGIGRVMRSRRHGQGPVRSHSDYLRITGDMRIDGARVWGLRLYTSGSVKIFFWDGSTKTFMGDFLEAILQSPAMWDTPSKIDLLANLFRFVGEAQYQEKPRFSIKLPEQVTTRALDYYRRYLSSFTEPDGFTSLRNFWLKLVQEVDAVTNTEEGLKISLRNPLTEQPFGEKRLSFSEIQIYGFEKPAPESATTPYAESPLRVIPGGIKAHMNSFGFTYDADVTGFRLIRDGEQHFVEVEGSKASATSREKIKLVD